MDRATGRIQTKRAINPASPFLKDGWYRAIILASDDGEGMVGGGGEAMMLPLSHGIP